MIASSARPPGAATADIFKDYSPSIISRCQPYVNLPEDKDTLVTYERFETPWRGIDIRTTCPVLRTSSGARVGLAPLEWMWPRRGKHFADPYAFDDLRLDELDRLELLRIETHPLKVELNVTSTANISVALYIKLPIIGLLGPILSPILKKTTTSYVCANQIDAVDAARPLPQPSGAVTASVSRPPPSMAPGATAGTRPAAPARRGARRGQRHADLPVHDPVALPGSSSKSRIDASLDMAERYADAKMQGFTWKDDPEVFEEIVAAETGADDEELMRQYIPDGYDDDFDLDFDDALDFADMLDALDAVPD